MTQMIAAFTVDLVSRGTAFTPGKSDDSPVFPPAGSVENGGLTGVGHHVSTSFLNIEKLSEATGYHRMPPGGVHHKPFYEGS